MRVRRTMTIVGGGLFLRCIVLLVLAALPALAAMVVGIFGGLAFMKALFGVHMRVSCKDDCYVSG